MTGISCLIAQYLFKAIVWTPVMVFYPFLIFSLVHLKHPTQNKQVCPSATQSTFIVAIIPDVGAVCEGSRRPADCIITHFKWIRYFNKPLSKAKVKKVGSSSVS